MNEHENFQRYSLLGGLLTILPFLIIVWIVRIQVNPEQAKKILDESVYWHSEVKVITPARGQIYDRWGNLLAGNQMVYEVGIELREVQDPQTIALTLSTILGIDYAKVLAAASLEPSDSAVYAVIASNVSQEKYLELAKILEEIERTYQGEGGESSPSVRGIVFKPTLARIYPENSLASNILGFVVHEGTGYFGVEERYNDLLAGKPKSVRVSLDPNQVTDLPVIPDGASLILTIDRAIQKTMENVLDEAIAESGSQSGTIVVMDPKTGEILALATTPRMDLNEFWKYQEVFQGETPFNRGISQAYEPGSVFKVLTMASALDNGTVTPTTPFMDTGTINVGGVPIFNWDRGAWGPQDMLGCMQHSLNVCLAWVATQLGTEQFYKYLQSFGIGHLSGVDMAGEVPGRLKVPGDSDWYAADLGTNAFGQGVAATPIQMAMAITAAANNGKIMAPHVVRSIVNEGYQIDIEHQIVGIPIRAETAQTLTEMLATSLEVESSVALVTGYRVAGKTGTAEIPTPLGYNTNETNASFVGWGPVDDPRFLVYIWLEKPVSAPWGSVVAAPVFRQAVQKLVVLLDLPPDDIRKQLNGN